MASVTERVPISKRDEECRPVLPTARATHLRPRHSFAYTSGHAKSARVALFTKDIPHQYRSRTRRHERRMPHTGATHDGPS